MNDEEVMRMEHLEAKAKKDFIENSEWTAIMEMLNPEERIELKALYELMDKAYEEHKIGESTETQTNLKVL